ncbi:hypothetical protein M5K25_011746 [Dendrobium thyrsiflorum]|uniref:Myb/SANT-like domain-containing protein n=1 Tax=Dendrobium thyrsiflorum TaxID=117978 RepID=A0ABD0V3W9_DENTH
MIRRIQPNARILAAHSCWRADVAMIGRADVAMIGRADVAMSLIRRIIRRIQENALNDSAHSVFAKTFGASSRMRHKIPLHSSYEPWLILPWLSNAQEEYLVVTRFAKDKLVCLIIAIRKVLSMSDHVVDMICSTSPSNTSTFFVAIQGSKFQTAKKTTKINDYGLQTAKSAMGRKYAAEISEGFHNLTTYVTDILMGKYRGSGPSATWPYDIVMMFCDLCLREIALGNRPSTHFTKVGWNNLVDSFKEWTGKDYDRIQLKNKWDQLKKEWKLWKDLKKGATGFGWNPKRRTLDAPDEWWKKKIQEFPAAKRFRYNGIDPFLEEKLDNMFMNMILPGQHAWAPNSGSLPAGLTEDGHGDFGDSESTKSLCGELPRLSSGLKRASQPSSLAKGNRSKMGSSKSGVSGAAEGVQQKLQGQTLQTQIQELVNAVTNSNKRTVAPSKSLSSITEAVAELDSIEELEENTELYGFAIDLLMQKDSREMFMALKPHKKVWYLKIEFEKSKRNTS